MAKASLTSLAAGLAARLGKLTVQTAKQAHTRAEKLARKGLTDATKMLDQALAATEETTVKNAKTAKVVKPKSKTALLPAPKGKRTTTR